MATKKPQTALQRSRARVKELRALIDEWVRRYHQRGDEINALRAWCQFYRKEVKWLRGQCSYHREQGDMWFWQWYEDTGRGKKPVTGERKPEPRKMPDYLKPIPGGLTHDNA